MIITLSRLQYTYLFKIVKNNLFNPFIYCHCHTFYRKGKLLLIIILALIMKNQSLNAQMDSCLFISPVKHQIISSGSFGEPRSTHFHSGVDIKPYHGSGKDPLVAIGDGYISRIRITPDSYGKAIYLDHPCGYTSVYAHMDSFSSTIENYIDKVRIATKNSEIDQIPPPNALKIKQGDILGFMGNSGNSFGAHLHFEIRNTTSEAPINPVLFGIGPKDNIAPIIRGLVVYELDQNRKVLSQSYYPATKKNNTSYDLNNDTLEVSWPLIGFGLHVYDMSNGAGNHNGIHKLQYKVNGEKRFSFSIDSVPFDKSIFLHAHMDYGFKKQNKYVHKCYKEELNSLDIYTSSKFGQLLIPNQLFPNSINILAADIFGNTASLNFNIRGKQELNTISPSVITPNIGTNDSTFMFLDSFSLAFAPSTFLHPEFVKLKIVPNGISILSTKESIPFFKNFNLDIDPKNLNLPDFNPLKLTYITIDRKGRKVNLGGDWVNNKFVLKSNDFGTYQVVTDITPPKLVIIKNESQTNVILQITDNLKTKGKTTRMTYSCLLDGQWIPLDYDEKNNHLIISSKWLQSGMHCKIEVMDFNQNRTIKEFTIN